MKRFHALWGVVTIVPLAGIGPVVIGQEVLVRDGGAFRQLALATARPFHETTNAIVNVRTLAIPNSDGLAVLWGELGHHGGGPSAFDDHPKSTTAKALMINAAYRYDWAHELIQDAHLATPQLDAAYGLVIRGVRRTTPGNLNCDGEVNFGDINPFVLALTNPGGYYAVFPNCWSFRGDINGDGRVDFGDINPFVRLLTNP